MGCECYMKISILYSIAPSHLDTQSWLQEADAIVGIHGH